MMVMPAVFVLVLMLMAFFAVIMGFLFAKVHIMLVMMPVFVVMFMLFILMVMMVLVDVVMAAVAVAEKIRHIVVMVIMFKNHVEVADIDSAFLNTANFSFKALQRNRIENLLQNGLVCAKIKKRRYSHIAAYTRFTFQIQ